MTWKFWTWFRRKPAAPPPSVIDQEEAAAKGLRALQNIFGRKKRRP